MIHRVRAAGILVEDGRILLVHEGEMPDGQPYFIPPGGGFETSDYSIADCLSREFWEETGISVEADAPLFIKEYVNHTAGVHHVELFFLVRRAAVQKPPGQPDRPWRWFTLDELQAVTVFPPELKAGTWASGSAACRYLGRSDGAD